MIKLYNIVAVVNEGFSDLVMDCAREHGAKGGTIISANGSVSDNAEKLYGISINPSKEIILILVAGSILKDVLTALYTKAGSGTDAMGIFFSTPVSYVSENLLRQYDEGREEK